MTHKLQDKVALVSGSGRGIGQSIARVTDADFGTRFIGTALKAAGAVYIFCIPESNYVSGQVLVCGGGRP